MIELYTWTTPNGYKPLIMLEELEWPYTLHPVDLGKKEQFSERFLRINPNGKIPAIVDSRDDGTVYRVFESGAILIYLAERSRRFLEASGPARYETFQWLMFQMAGVGPMMGQAYHFAISAEQKLPYAISRYLDETRRLLGVLDGRLARSAYLAGDYSIADMATYPWVARLPERLGIDCEAFPNIRRWVDDIAKRPAVDRAYHANM